MIFLWFVCINAFIRVCSAVRCCKLGKRKDENLPQEVSFFLGHTGIPVWCNKTNNRKEG